MAIRGIDLVELSRKLDFLDELELAAYDLFEEFFIRSWQVERDVKSAIAYMVMHNRRFKGMKASMLDFTCEVAEASQNTDALVYHLNCISQNRGLDEVVEMISALKGLSWSQDCYSLIDLFLSCAKWSVGDYAGYVAGLKDFFSKKREGFNPYLSIPASTAWLGVSTPSVVENEVVSSLRTHIPSAEVNYVISVSCDRKYYDKYSSFLMGSLAAIDDGGYVHISLVDGDPAMLEQGDNYCVVGQGIVSESNIGPIASALRFLHAGDLLDALGCPVIVMDFDAAFLKSPHALIDIVARDGDIGLRMLKAGLPWQKITAGFTVLLNNEACKNYLQVIKAYYTHILKMEGVQWWVDQNAIECGSRFALIDAVKVNVMSHIPDYIVIPTGSEVAKIKQLGEALTKLS